MACLVSSSQLGVRYMHICIYIYICVVGPGPGRTPPHGIPPWPPRFPERDLSSPFNGSASRLAEPVVRFHDVWGLSSELLSTQNWHRKGVLDRMSFSSLLLFVFLKDPTLDSIAPAQSKRS